MIKKFLVVGKHVYVSSKPMEMREEGTVEMELLLPIKVFWQLEDQMKDADYYLANGDDKVVVNDLYKNVFKLVGPYAVHEKDRFWLHAQSKP